MEKIREAGFKISLSKETTLTREMAEQLYSEHKGKEFFEDLTGLMSKSVSYVHYKCPKKVLFHLLLMGISPIPLQWTIAVHGTVTRRCSEWLESSHGTP